jgi:hypothetical protein
MENKNRQPPSSIACISREFVLVIRDSPRPDEIHVLYTDPMGEIQHGCDYDRLT